MGARLIVANVVERAPLPLSASMGYDDLPYTEEMAESLTEPVRLAPSLGGDVTRFRVKRPHPIPATLEAVAEKNPGLVVFGPDRRRVMRPRNWAGTPAHRS